MSKAKDPMAHMIGVDGANSLDMNLLPVSRIVDGYEDGKTARDFVTEVMLENWSSRKMSDEVRSLFDDLVDSVLALSDTTLSGEDAQAVAYADGRLHRIRISLLWPGTYRFCPYKEQ